MKAVVFDEHGGPEVLQYREVQDPRIEANEVLVEVRACALNHLDVWARGGLPGIEIPLPHILGNDITGVVREAGALVTWVRPGDEVMLQPGVSCGHCLECLRGQDNLCAEYDILGYRRDGGYAELVKAPGVNVIPKPKNLAWEEAAALPLVTVTAWHMLVTRAQVQPGEDVLIHAAGSGVGSIAIQIAKLRGARVVATAGSDEKLQKARELGADETVNYTREDWPKEVRRLTGKRGVDARTDIRQVFYRHLSLLGSFMGSKAELLDAMKFIERGAIRAVVDRTLPLAEARRAHELMEDRAQFGKLVLIP
jgi:NADPH:quinone reductase-like Zn-dependent oxidoreductase